MRTVLVVLVLMSASELGMAADDDARTWEGTWVNRRYNSNGTLRCVATPGKDGTWTATFSGVFMKEQFSFDVKFQGKPGSGQTDLSGNADIRNHKYEWTGAIKGDSLTGRYRSNSGYFGEFTLREIKRKK